MERGWLVSSSFNSRAGAETAAPERSYQISPIVLWSRPALLHGRASTTPQGLDSECAIACSIVINPCFVLNDDRRLRKQDADRCDVQIGERRCSRHPPLRQKKFRWNRPYRWHYRLRPPSSDLSTWSHFATQMNHRLICTCLSGVANGKHNGT